MVRRDDSHTYVVSKSFSVVFTTYQSGGVEGPHAGQDLASLSISRGQLVEGFRFGELDLLHPVQGKAIDSSVVIVRAAYSEELALPPLEGLLKQCQGHPSRYAAKAHPEAFPLLLHFEEMKEDVDGGDLFEVPAQNVERFDEGMVLIDS